MNPPMGLSWMAWTWQTALFFLAIAIMLAIMVAWELKRPGGAPRRGILGLLTTRGDRLFIGLLAAAYIHLAWLGLLGTPLWGAGVASLLLGIAIFRFV